MSKNITIQEGGTAKQMTVDKLKTDTVGSGSCLWVPEDETTLKTKNISNNGTYLASSDNAYGYSQVTVNVPGGDGSATSSGTPTTSNGVDPGGIGSSVIGKDTSGVISGTPGGDGNEYAIGVDSGGNIVATKVPSGIEIGKAPDKTSYTEGETIDYSGIIVILKGGDGEIFSNQDYPNGRIPFNELIFPVTTAHGEGGEGGASSDIVTPGVSQPIPWTNSFTTKAKPDYPLYDDSITYGARFVIGQRSGSNWYYLACSDTLGTYTRVIGQTENHPQFTRSYTHNGKTVYYVEGNAAWSSSIEGGVPVSGNIQTGEVAWTVVYGAQSGGVSIPVQWKSPYDGRTFEDTFEITVTGSSGGGYSDDSGGSESGGGGNF